MVHAQPAQQGLLIDRIIAVVGTEIVLFSDLQARLDQARQAGMRITDDLTCEEFEDLLYEKLLLDQARLDSVTVDDGQVEAELDRRVRYFVSQLGSEQKLEEFYGKTITEIKADFREQVKDQLLVQTMQQQVTADVRVTPRDVERFFKKIPEDSVPFINAEVEYAQILRIPKASEEEDRRVRRRLEEFREAVVSGEKEFCTLAVLYSEDPGSAANCGELGLVPTGVMVPEFDAVAMSLKEGEVSQVFSTQFGYHFMQLIDRRGEQYNARHILMRPQIGSEDLNNERRFLDSIATGVRAGTIEFAKAATEHSDDEDSRGTNGLVIEPNSNSARWPMGALDQQTFFVVDKLTPGDISQPQLITMPDGSKAYRIIRLIVRTEPHRAELKRDYRIIQQAAEADVRAKAVQKWTREKVASTYVKLYEAYHTCSFQHGWGDTAGQ